MKPETESRHIANLNTLLVRPEVPILGRTVWSLYIELDMCQLRHKMMRSGKNALEFEMVAKEATTKSDEETEKMFRK